MQVAEKTDNLERFFHDVARAPARVLLLDYDGTLAPFNIDPAVARPWPGVVERLDAIMDDACTQVVIVSGRWTRDLLPLLPLKRQPEIWGSHGWEQLRDDGAYELAQLDDASLKGLVDADEWTRAIEEAGGRCERKPGSLAIHWRGATPNQIAAVRRLVFDNWMDQGLHRHLTWHDFDGGVELRAPGRDKGYAVATTLARYPGCAAAYLGDDFTDEDAFAAINPRGLSVLVRDEYRPTVAKIWLRPPHELTDFLDRWHDACASDA